MQPSAQFDAAIVEQMKSDTGRSVNALAPLQTWRLLCISGTQILFHYPHLLFRLHAAISAMLAEFAGSFPEVMPALIHERDVYLVRLEPCALDRRCM